jgi:hypothetical protein
MSLRLIGDVHGKVVSYLKICKEAEAAGENTLQIGDLGFGGVYTYIRKRGLDPQIHRMFKGNHDDYNWNVHEFPYDLGDFGAVPGYPHMFFVRGGFSIDRKYRTPGATWFVEEELKHSQWAEAIALYRQLKPKVLISHEPPHEFGRAIGNPDMLRMFGFDPQEFKTTTATYLQMMIDEHAPELVVCGHFHVNREMTIGSTTFVCLGELCSKVI